MAVGGVEADLGGYMVAAGRGGRDGRRTSTGRVEDGGGRWRVGWRGCFGAHGV